MKAIVCLLTLVASTLPLGAQALERAPAADLGQQWRWALTESNSRSDPGGFWVGFSFGRLMRPGRFIVSGSSWISTGGTLMSRGVPLREWLRRGGDAGNTEAQQIVTIEGSESGELVSREIAVLFAFPAGASDAARIEKARLADVELPFDPQGRPLVWLGSHPAAATVSQLQRLYASSPADRAREEIVTAVGLHDVPEEAIDFLAGVLRGDASEKVRDEAASALGRFADPRAVAALVEAIGSDDSLRVRREAVEALGRIKLEAAETALIEVARTADAPRIRREAAESLGRRASPEAAAALERIAFEDADLRVQREAVESMCRLPEAAALAGLGRILSDHPAERVRREAVESLASFPAEIGLPRLIEVAEQNSSPGARREAIEQLARSAGRQAVDTLEGIASDSRDGLNRRALEALLDMEDDAGLDAVIEIARSHPNAGVRKLAIRELGDSDDPRAHRALLEIVKSGLGNR